MNVEVSDESWSARSHFVFVGDARLSRDDAVNIDAAWLPLSPRPQL